jgi:uroporphyrin-III C-methyltransferase
MRAMPLYSPRLFTGEINMTKESATVNTAPTTAVFSPQASPKKSFSTLILFLFVLALGGSTGWLGWQYLQRMEKQITALQLSMPAQQQNFESQQNNMITERLNTAEKTFRQMQADLLKQQQQEQDPLHTKTHYHLLEADYMARLAALNLSFGQNIPAAIALLQTADQRIKETDNPNLNKIRQTLADAILSLQAVPSVDTAGLLTRLNALQSQVSRLPLFGLAQPTATVLPEPETNTTTIDATEKKWKRALKETWVTLQKIIIIRHRNQPIAPLVAPEQESYLRQNLHLLLQQAQWGVINGNAAIYEASLQQAIDWIQQYFAVNERATLATLSLLTSLQQIKIQPTLPNISPALQALKEALDGTKPNPVKSPVQAQGENQA